MTAMAIFVALLAPASEAQASGFSFVLATMPTVTAPGAYQDTVIAVASVDGPMTIDVTGLDGTTITQVDDLDCSTTPTGAHCAFTAAAGITNMIGVSGAYANDVVHLQLAASDAAGPVSFAADTSYPVLPTTWPAPPITVPPITVPPITVPPITVPPVTIPPIPTPPLTQAAFTRTMNTLAATIGQTTATVEARIAAAKKAAARLTRRRSRVISFTNNERAMSGLGGLTSNPQLTLSAERYAQHLALDRAFSHTDGSTLAQRIEAAGYRYRVAGENLGMGQPTARTIVAAWMASPEHRSNMLDSRFTQIGVGVATRADGQIVWCIDLGMPSK